MATTVISSPHAHDHSSVSRIMSHVCLALAPCTLFSFYLFGWPAINLFIITLASGLMWEWLCLRLQGKSSQQLGDYSALVTCWLLALTLPPWAPWWIGVGGSFVAIVIAKHLYGGIGQNVFNPAMVARVALLISFPVHMTTWPTPEANDLAVHFMDSLQLSLGMSDIPEALTGATTLGAVKTGLSMDLAVPTILSEHFSLTTSGMGFAYGSMGETSSLFILLGGIWLLSMRVISWHIPVSMLLSIAILTTLFNLIDGERYAPAGVHLLSGGLMLGAFFIATDPVTSPSSKGGQIVFGVGCGVLDFVIRTFGSFPEGLGFAVLFMNALTPLIDIYFRPRIYGRNYDGSPSRPANTEAPSAASESLSKGGQP